MSGVIHTACLAIVVLISSVQVSSRNISYLKKDEQIFQKAPSTENDLYQWVGYNEDSQKVEIKSLKNDLKNYREYLDGKERSKLPLQLYIQPGQKAVILQQGKPWKDANALPVILTDDAYHYGSDFKAWGKFLAETEWKGQSGGAEFKFYGAPKPWAEWTFEDGGRGGKKILINYIQSVVGPALIMKLERNDWAAVCDSRECRGRGNNWAMGTWFCGAQACDAHCCKDRVCCAEGQTCGDKGTCLKTSQAGSPAPVQAESPAPGQAESPAPGQAESPAPGQAESPAPGQAESPAPGQPKQP